MGVRAARCKRPNAPLPHCLGSLPATTWGNNRFSPPLPPRSTPALLAHAHGHDRPQDDLGTASMAIASQTLRGTACGALGRGQWSSRGMEALAGTMACAARRRASRCASAATRMYPKGELVSARKYCAGAGVRLRRVDSMGRAARSRTPVGTERPRFVAHARPGGGSGSTSTAIMTRRMYPR